MHLAHHKAEYTEEGYGSTGSLHGAPKRRLMLLPSMMTAIYGWHPDSFGTLGALRMGNYEALEFLYSGRMHSDSGHGAPDPPSNP